jgi:histidinol-phosphate phosphatase family protein
MIAKGIGTQDDMQAINREIEKRLAKQGAKIDAFYSCPHHPKGTIKEYAVACACRKPGTGMIEDGIRDFKIDSGRSFLVGDKTSDILAGQKSGLKTILVKTGYGGSDKHYNVTPDFVAKNLVAAIKHYIS